MEIISPEFVFFSFLAVFLYHLLPWRYKQVWLLVISYIFYILVDFRYALVLLILSSANYLISFLSQKSRTPKLLLNTAIILDLLSFLLLKWITSKYAGGFLETDSFQGYWLLPVGFSFYVLQLISFQLSVKKKAFPTFPRFLQFQLFLVYFPKLLSGPIEKPANFFRIIAEPKLVDKKVLSDAFGLIYNGLLRKLVIADGLSAMVPYAFLLDGNPSWLALITYAFIIYNDFSGYTSLVRGVSLFFGIELSQNFQQPYLARNFSEFWNRWHISLTTWLRETIYFPLSRKIDKQKSFFHLLFNISLPPMATMLASGLWHGFSLGMVFWGGFHGLLLIFERLIYEIFPTLRPVRLNKTGQLFSRIMTFSVICLSWLPFQSASLKQSIFSMLLLFTKPDINCIFPVIFPLVLVLLSFFLDYFLERFQSEYWWRFLNQPMRTLILTATVLMLIAAVVSHIGAPTDLFIYQGF